MVLIYSLFSLLSCGIKKTSIVQQKTLEIKPKLIFLNYTVSKEKNDHKKIEFINKIITEGKSKKDNNVHLNIGAIGDLKCQQLDENSNIVQEFFIENPLIKTFEFVNDSLTFDKKQVNLKSSELSLRLQLYKETRYIVISEVIDSLQNTETLIKTDLE